MLNESGFNLSGGETVTRDVNDIVDTATDPVVAVLVTASTVTSELRDVSNGHSVRIKAELT